MSAMIFTRRAALVGAAASSIALAFPMAASLAKAATPLAAAEVDMRLRIDLANKMLRWLKQSTPRERRTIAAEWRTKSPDLREIADFVENWRPR